MPLGNVVGLGPQGSTKPLFDTSISPLADFHNRERMLREILHQVDIFMHIPFSNTILKEYKISFKVNKTCSVPKDHLFGPF